MVAGELPTGLDCDTARCVFVHKEKVYADWLAAYSPMWPVAIPHLGEGPVGPMALTRSLEELLDDAEAESDSHRFGPAVDIEAFEDGLQIGLDRGLGDTKRLGDLFVLLTAGHS